MTRVAYVNGAYVPMDKASVSILDRGLQFADSIYEVWSVRDGRLIDDAAHLERLKHSLSELRMTAPMDERALGAVIRETMRRNRVRDGIVYLQVTRGAAPRDHAFPAPSVRPTMIATAKNLDKRALDARALSGVAVTTTPEARWARRDIKSTNLLPNVLARQAAREAGAFEAWFVDASGYVTEGTSSNAWIVDMDGNLRTRALSSDILHGVTRAALIQTARRLGLEVVENAFTVAEAKAAREAFISAASNPAVAVIAIDGAPIGARAPGPVTQRLRQAYLKVG